MVEKIKKVLDIIENSDTYMIAPEIQKLCDAEGIHSENKEKVFRSVYDEILSPSMLTKFISDIKIEYFDCTNSFNPNNANNLRILEDVSIHQLLSHFDAQELDLFVVKLPKNQEYLELFDYIKKQMGSE